MCKTAATGLVRTACQGVGLKPPRTLKRIETNPHPFAQVARRSETTANLKAD